jgi:hypothetical protein
MANLVLFSTSIWSRTFKMVIQIIFCVNFTNMRYCSVHLVPGLASVAWGRSRSTTQTTQQSSHWRGTRRGSTSRVWTARTRFRSRLKTPTPPWKKCPRPSRTPVSTAHRLWQDRPLSRPLSSVRAVWTKYRICPICPLVSARGRFARVVWNMTPFTLRPIRLRS